MRTASILGAATLFFHVSCDAAISAKSVFDNTHLLGGALFNTQMLATGFSMCNQNDHAEHRQTEEHPKADNWKTPQVEDIPHIPEAGLVRVRVATFEKRRHTSKPKGIVSAQDRTWS